MAVPAAPQRPCRPEQAVAFDPVSVLTLFSNRTKRTMIVG